MLEASPRFCESLHTSFCGRFLTWGDPGLQNEEQQAACRAAGPSGIGVSRKLTPLYRREAILVPVLWQERHLTTNSLLKAIHAAGYGSKEFTSHDFRHMAVTLLKELGFPHDVIHLQLSHTFKRDAAKAAYDKAQLLPQRREMMQAYADYLDTLREEARKRKED